jgi:hypothetical protein
MAFIVVLASSVGSGQVKTTVPDVVPGARPATVERITIHGKALEGNLEGDAVDRTVLVFLPPSYSRERSRRYPVVYGFTATRLARSNGRRRSTCRRPLKVRSRSAPKR